MLEKLGGRKFIVTLFCLVLVFALVLLRIVTPETFVDFVKLVLSVYTAGNVGAKLAVSRLTK